VSAGLRCRAGPSFLYFDAPAGLSGVVFWGRPTVADVERLFEHLHRSYARPGRTDLLLDLRRLTPGPPDFAAGSRGAELFEAGADQFQRGGGSVALVLKKEQHQVTVAGMMTLGPIAIRAFESAEEALLWLSPKTAARELLAELSERAREAARAAPVLGVLRASLDGAKGRLALGAAARALGQSARSLQRKLRDEGTSFQAESAAAKVRAAKELLLHSDHKLAAIALEIGCSPQSFSALFRRATGKSPSRWKAAQRP